jgi:putative tryptophan/tyrosine transport system substrate-binding protein
MRRREFIVTAAAAAGVSAFAAYAQESTRQRRIAIAIPGRFWTDGAKSNPYYGAFFEELARLGFAQGRNLVVDSYSSAGEDTYPEVARTVATSRPEIILAGTFQMINAIQAATARTVPIVGIVGDPIADGLVSSLARPGANVTGITVDAGVELQGKRLSLLSEVRPDATRVAYLSSSAVFRLPQAAIVKQAAEALKLSLSHIDLESLNEEACRAASDSIQRAKADLLMIAEEPVHLSNSRALVGIARNAQVPATYPFREFVVAGGLMAYSLDGIVGIRQAAQQVAQILNGANPAEMPFRQPTSFKLSINTKAAREIGVVLPPTLLASADEVIE